MRAVLVQLVLRPLQVSLLLASLNVELSRVHNVTHPHLLQVVQQRWGAGLRLLLASGGIPLPWCNPTGGTPCGRGVGGCGLASAWAGAGVVSSLFRTI